MFSSLTMALSEGFFRQSLSKRKWLERSRNKRSGLLEAGTRVNRSERRLMYSDSAGRMALE